MGVWGEIRLAYHLGNAGFGQWRLPQLQYEMTVWAHSGFSQRATKPPSAAVRQARIASITFNCARLTCPRLASSQAGPKSRKMSATSRAGRCMGAPGYVGGSSSGRSGVKRSSGLVTARSTLVATCA